MRPALKDFCAIQVEDLTSLLLEETQDGEAPPESWAGSHNTANFPQAFVLGFSSLMLDLSSLRPRPEQVPYLWKIFAERVDPLFKILHKPTTQKVIIEFDDMPGRSAKNMEPLVFSIYFATVSKLSQEDCRKHLNEDKDKLLTRYHFAAEQALARAEFLTSAELVVLQALVLFMVSKTCGTELFVAADG